MEDFHHKLKELIKSKLLIEFKIFHIKDLYVIYYGQIQLMKEKMVLVHHLEEQDLVGDKILVRNLTLEIN